MAQFPWLAAAISVAFAVLPSPALADPKIINDPARLDWDYYGSYSIKPIPGVAIPGKGAVEVKVDKGQNLYDAGANIPIGPITKDKDYVVQLWARTISTASKDGKGKILVRFFRNKEPYPGFGDTMVDIGTDWQAYEVHARADQSIADAAAVGLQFAGAKQVIQVGQATVAEGVVTLANQPAKATAADPLPPGITGKGTLLNDPLNRRWVAYGKTLTTFNTTTDVYTRKGTLMMVSAAGDNGYDAGLNVPIRDAIAKGDKLIIAVLARSKSASTSDGIGLIQLHLQTNQPPYPGFGNAGIKLAPNWRLYQWPVTSEMDLPAGQGEVAIHAGLTKQEIEIGPVYVIRLP